VVETEPVPPSFRQRPAWRSIALALALATVPLLAGSAGAATAEASVQLLLRADDIGMNHSVDAAIARLVATGLPFSASVMFACPWYQEAVEILRDQPQVSVGIHLTLNSEWQHYKWGPVLGRSRVPTLVDADGNFHTTEADFAAAHPDLDEVRQELRAQIERALATGLDIDYVDYHMLTALSTPELRAIVEDLAREYGLGMSRYFGEASASLWDVAPERKLTELLRVVDRLRPLRPNLVVLHLALDNPEMKALVDANNPSDPYRVAEHRSAELAAVTSPAFRQALAARSVELLTYRDLVDRLGLDALHAPESSGYSMGDDGDQQ
jgi:predicted glycoside hydrolase/deacetylase ChbG (UPF0249 family)